jgi:Tat protein secretion system quality control protein TatD with DNase activity
MLPVRAPKSSGFASRNEPCLLGFVAEKLAKCYGESIEKIGNATTKTTIEFFNLKESK